MTNNLISFEEKLKLLDTKKKTTQKQRMATQEEYNSISMNDSNFLEGFMAHRRDMDRTYELIWVENEAVQTITEVKTHVCVDLGGGCTEYIYRKLSIVLPETDMDKLVDMFITSPCVPGYSFIEIPLSSEVCSDEVLRVLSDLETLQRTLEFKLIARNSDLSRAGVTGGLMIFATDDQDLLDNIEYAENR